MPKPLRGGNFDRTVRSWRRIDDDAVIGEHFFRAEKMKSIADNERRSPTFCLQKTRDRTDAVICASASRFRNNVRHRDTMLNQVLLSDFRLGEVGVRTVTPRSNDGRRQMMLVQLERMIEPRLEYRRRSAVILRRS